MGFQAFEHLISLGPQVWRFAAAETGATPKVQISCMDKIDHSCGVVPGNFEGHKGENQWNKWKQNKHEVKWSEMKRNASEP